MGSFDRKKKSAVNAKIEQKIGNQVQQQFNQSVEAFIDKANAQTFSDLRQMAMVTQAISGGYDFADTLHNIYIDYGYPSELNFFNFWNMYRRFGIARNIVELPSDTGWMNIPEIEANEQFLNEFEILDKQIRFWDRLRAWDTRQRVGRYAGLFIRVRDGKRPSEPLERGSLNGIGSVVALVPMYEGQLIVSQTEGNPIEDDFGLPTMYEFNSGSAGNRNEKANASFNIHPSRVLIAAEGADNGGIYGISSLEAPYNSLMDLRKIIGAGGEGFYKNAAQNIVFNLKDGSSAKQNEALLTKFNEAYDDFALNRMRRAMWTPGLEPNALESNLTSPEHFFNIALNDVAAASKIPATILIGQQTGRLASTEDSRQFLSGINSRRENFMSGIVRDVIDWFIMNGVLPSSDYEIEWSDLLELGQKDRLENASSMSQINERQFKAGQDIPFSSEEIREQAGFEAEEISDEGEELDELESE